MDHQLDSTSRHASSSNVVALNTRTSRTPPAANSTVAFLPKCPLPSASPSTRQERVLLELHRRQEILYREASARSERPADTRYRLICEVIQLSNQQMTSGGRRDHARCEQLLKRGVILRDAIEARHKSNRSRDPVAAQLAERDASIDRELAQQVMGLMELAAACNPDESEYSSEWRRCLDLHADDLSQVIEADLKGTPLEAPHYRRDHRVSGRFTFASDRTQVELIRDLRDGFGFQSIKQQGQTAVCFAPLSRQLALVSRKRTIRYIDFLKHLRSDGELPDCRFVASVDQEIDPPSVTFYQQSGDRRRLAYNWALLDYV